MISSSLFYVHTKHDKTYVSETFVSCMVSQIEQRNVLLINIDRNTKLIKD